MRVIRSALVIGLAAGLLPSPAIAQSSRGSFTPTCDAGLQVGNITSSQVSANCRQQDLASHVLNECINSFVADVDAVGQKGEQLAATVRELQSLQGQERIRKTVQAANREAGLVTKALKLIKEIRKGSGVLQDYAGDCMSNGLLDSLGLPEGEARQFAALGGATRIAPGTVLPAPQGVFPRYIEPTAA